MATYAPITILYRGKEQQLSINPEMIAAITDDVNVLESYGHPGVQPGAAMYVNGYKDGVIIFTTSTLAELEALGEPPVE